MVVASWDVPRSEKGAFEKVLTNPLNYDFIFGMTAAWLVRKGVARDPWWCLALGTLGSVGGYSLYYAVTGVDRVDDYWAVLIFGLPASLITYAVVVLEQRKGWVFARRLGWVGDAAYSLYLTHVMSVVLVGRLWHEIGIPGWPAHLAFLATAIGFGVWVGWFAYQKIEKPLISHFRNFDPARRRALAP
jgi:peptidoglycan/LPS O-acetylase OafA/YrhL